MVGVVRGGGSKFVDDAVPAVSPQAIPQVNGMVFARFVVVDLRK